MKALIDELAVQHTLSQKEWCLLLRSRTPELERYLFEKARQFQRQYYGNQVYIRGLIEFTNHCKNDCYYCGLRRSNFHVQRYRLTRQEILACCREGYGLGYRTFVLQGGEDPAWTPEAVSGLVSAIKAQHPDCAVTLSVGEQSRQVYQLWFNAGADRYLLRQETANPMHYHQLHPPELSPENRKRCLWDLKEIGYQVGCGFMVGSPGQTPEHLAEDLLFIRQLEPDMVGIGPFLPQHDTPFRDKPAGDLHLTLFLLGLLRVMLPNVLLPATTALATLDQKGRELGILAGANVCMPNLSPPGVREKYALYDNKACTGDEAAQSRRSLERRMQAIGYQVVVDRGDHKSL